MEEDCLTERVINEEVLMKMDTKRILIFKFIFLGHDEEGGRGKFVTPRTCRSQKRDKISWGSDLTSLCVWMLEQGVGVTVNKSIH